MDLPIVIGIEQLPPQKSMVSAQIICTAMSLNCSFILYNGTEFGDGLDNGTGTGMIGAVQRGEFDTFEPFFTPTFRRFKAVDFSNPVFYEDILMVTRAPKAQKSSFSLDIVTSLKWETWLVFTVALLVTSAFIRFLLSSSFGTEKSKVHWFLDIISQWSALITHKHDDEKSMHLHVRLVIMCWSLAAIVICSSYTAILFSQKMRASVSLPYTDFESFVTCLEEGRCSLITKTLSISFAQVLFANEYSLGRRAQTAFALRPPVITSDFNVIGDRILQDQSTFLVWFGARAVYVEFFKSIETCPFYVIEAPYKEAWTFPVRKNSSLKKILDKAAEFIRETGLDQGISAHFGKEDCQSQVSMVGGNLNDASTINAALCFLSGGIIVGISGLILELAWKKLKWRQGESENL